MSRPPNQEFQEWWNKQQSANGSEDLFPSSSENSRFLTVEISSPTVAEKERTRSARQLSWIYLLKFQQIANLIAFLTSGFISIVCTANRRIVTSNSAHPRSDSRRYHVIKVFLTVSVILLVFELVAYFRGWHFSPPTVESASAEVLDLAEYVYSNWLDIRANYLAPPLQSLINMCIVLFLIQSVDRVVLVLGCFWIKFRGLKPLAEIDYSSDVENLNAEYYPMVLLQIPMCNERENFPSQSQVSRYTNNRLQQYASRIGLRTECSYKFEMTPMIWVFKDLSRLKYKSGNRGGHDDVALVQTRWAFVNKDENLLTRLQNINLAFHFEVEQQVNGWFINFFGFNGTAGVWRIKALEECGGWLERTTVEDMDIAVRAHLCGWKFIYVNDVKCLCELPESYETYKKQQHRWHSGPMQLFRLCFSDILRSKLFKGDASELSDEGKEDIEYRM
ncbi:hypothetical protein KY290_036905 [Solanum tuberosum]|uniref:Glycosyltransferase 2-like domain-containing protein n=1 Tax=Solanum tuberosum TaxID=4113 RepID=A0ABQ7TXU0_SOLTU|nr:hypothetical protein KY290_036905 [Solanum tuberosum]